MKIIEALKRIKANKVKIQDLQTRVSKVCANNDCESPMYGEETPQKIKEWIQSCTDLTQENARLLCCIQYTNLKTPVSIEIGGASVTKSIAEWVWRRREYAKIDQDTYSKLWDRNLKEGSFNDSLGNRQEVKIVRHYDPNHRDKMIEIFREEPLLIDSTLEIINATTDLIEVY